MTLNGYFFCLLMVCVLVILLTDIEFLSFHLSSSFD